MASLDLEHEIARVHPLDTVEQFIAAQSFPYERAGDDEIVLTIDGRWCVYRLWFAWEGEIDALLFSCAFDMKLPSKKRDGVHALLALINERMWIGHFDIWAEEASPAYRHGMLLSGGAPLAIEQVEDLIDIAVAECERYYPAFQYVLWGGKKPDEAMRMAVLDPQGEA
ncbi:MAG: YbjN domain-containing protein [Alphaproteobacteria bacterium]